MQKSVPLVWLLALVAPASGQDPEHPGSEHRPNPLKKRERLESLVNLPEDFVQYARVPEGGIRPRLALGKDELALLYFKGDESHGDLYLTRSGDEAKTFAPSLRLDTTPASVAAWDGVQTGSIALGPDGLAHVAWISAGATPGLVYVHEARPDPKDAAGAKDGQSDDEVAGLVRGTRLDLGSPPGLCSTTALALDASGQIYLFYVAT